MKGSGGRKPPLQPRGRTAIIASPWTAQLRGRASDRLSSAGRQGAGTDSPKEGVQCQGGPQIKQGAIVQRRGNT